MAVAKKVVKKAAGGNRASRRKSASKKAANSNTPKPDAGTFVGTAISKMSPEQRTELDALVQPQPVVVGMSLADLNRLLEIVSEKPIAQYGALFTGLQTQAKRSFTQLAAKQLGYYKDTESKKDGAADSV